MVTILYYMCAPYVLVCIVCLCACMLMYIVCAMHKHTKTALVSAVFACALVVLCYYCDIQLLHYVVKLFSELGIIFVCLYHISVDMLFRKYLVLTACEYISRLFTTITCFDIECATTSCGGGVDKIHEILFLHGDFFPVLHLLIVLMRLRALVCGVVCNT